MEYIFNDIQNVQKNKIYFKDENQGCYIDNNELFIYNEYIYYIYKNNQWYTKKDNIEYPCGNGACPKLELNIEKDIIEELLYIYPDENDF